MNNTYLYLMDNVINNTLNKMQRCV